MREHVFREVKERLDEPLLRTRESARQLRELLLEEANDDGADVVRQGDRLREIRASLSTLEMTLRELEALCLSAKKAADIAAEAETEIVDDLGKLE